MAQGATGTPPWGETRVVGKGLPRIDAYARVSGSATYTLDVTLPGMLHAAIVRCPHGHALVKRVDLSKALAMPGVVAALGAEDKDAALDWYNEADKGAQSRLFDPHCRFAGEEVAAVAAENPYQAADAARQVVVEYEERDSVVDMDEALKDGAPRVHEGAPNLVREPSKYERGDVEKGFAEADLVVEETYRTSVEIHAPMETHGSVANWEGSQLTVWDSTQSAFDVQRALARVLKMPLSSVRVIGHYMGGGFGSKLQLSKHTVIAALLAKKTGRPVKAVLPREHSFLCVGNRPANTMTVKAGVKKDGTLTALEMRSRGVVGAYASWADATYLASELYRCPNVRTEDGAVYVNAGPERAFRAPGFPQCAWALEQTIDTIAAKLGIDPVEFRLKNMPEASQLRKNMPYTSNGLPRCLAEGARAFGWEAARKQPKGDGPIARGVGVAAGQWGWEGEPVSTVIAKLFSDGSLSLNFGAADIGTGTKTVMAMVASEELGIGLDHIRVEHADTGTSPYGVASGGSQTVHVNTPAAREAALALKRQVVTMAAAQLGVPEDDLALAGGEVASTKDPAKRVRISELKQLQQQQVIVGVGTRHPHPSGKIALPFAAQFAEVEVNRATGEFRVVRLLAAHDSGRIMNRLTFQNQVFGGMTMGIGFGMTEERVMDPQTGQVLTANLHDYKLPTAADVPADMTCMPIDPRDTECNTTGTKGVGEPATIPTAAAIANAIFDAVGVRMTTAPITPARLVARLVNPDAQFG
ncbi:MAG: xanthine dehydrogenase family protein molybdopterin-binding subunit [Acidobacteria bacterium]|nr:xanthine dehydrogenase family protein molybdopterin-binding subunit [Acidobacteriota bacterium]